MYFCQTNLTKKIFMKMEKSIKRIKLHYKSRLNTQRLNRDVPWLNVSGLWLERAGFAAGRQVEIVVENRKLTIIAL